jgi:hypothetical protein
MENSEFRIVPAHAVPAQNRVYGHKDAGKRNPRGKHPNQAKRFPCFAFSGKGKTYLPNYLHKQDDADTASAALILMTTDALIRATGIKAPVPARGTLAQYLASPDPAYQGECERQFGRTLVDPARYSRKYLRMYLERLAPFATAHSSTSNIDPVSPRLAAFLLGGMTLGALEVLCHDAMDVLEIPTPVVDATLVDAMTHVGYGIHADHSHFDLLRADLFNWRLHEDHDAYLRRQGTLTYVEPSRITTAMSQRQHYLVYELPHGASFASALLAGKGAYQGAEQQVIAKMKPFLLRDVTHLFNGPTDQGMTEFMYERLVDGNLTKYRQAIALDDAQFSRAVRRVYEKPWAELDFHATTSHISDDVEVMIARMIISRLASSRRSQAKPVLISAVVLLGMALLTGIPICKWIAFALQELDRRGETFINDKTLDEVIEMLEMSEIGQKAGPCIAEIREYQVALRSTESEYKARFAWKLRRGSRPFWTAQTYGPETYYLEGYGDKDEPVYKFNFDPYLERD